MPRTLTAQGTGAVARASAFVVGATSLLPSQPGWEKFREGCPALAYVLLSYEPVVIGVIADSQGNHQILGALRELKQALWEEGRKNPAGATSVTERYSDRSSTPTVPLYTSNDKKDILLLVQGDVVDLELSRIVQLGNQTLDLSAVFSDYPVSIAEAMQRLAADGTAR